MYKKAILYTKKNLLDIEKNILCSIYNKRKD